MWPDPDLSSIFRERSSGSPRPTRSKRRRDVERSITSASIKEHAAFVKRLEAAGIRLDEPPRTTVSGNLVTYITNPWGTRVEIVQRASLGPEVK